MQIVLCPHTSTEQAVYDALKYTTSICTQGRASKLPGFKIALLPGGTSVLVEVQLIPAPSFQFGDVPRSAVSSRLLHFVADVDVDGVVDLDGDLWNPELA